MSRSREDTAVQSRKGQVLPPPPISPHSPKAGMCAMDTVSFLPSICPCIRSLIPSFDRKKIHCYQVPLLTGMKKLVESAWGSPFSSGSSLGGLQPLRAQPSPALTRPSVCGVCSALDQAFPKSPAVSGTESPFSCFSCKAQLRVGLVER